METLGTIIVWVIVGGVALLGLSIPFIIIGEILDKKPPSKPNQGIENAKDFVNFIFE